MRVYVDITSERSYDCDKVAGQDKFECEDVEGAPNYNFGANRVSATTQAKRLNHVHAMVLTCT